MSHVMCTQPKHQWQVAMKVRPYAHIYVYQHACPYDLYREQWLHVTRIDSCFSSCMFLNNSVHGHLLGNVTRSALENEGFVPVLSVIVGVAILSATALLLLIAAIVSIPTLCLITRWVYTTMHSSRHYARVSVVCAPPPSLYILARLFVTSGENGEQNKRCVYVYMICSHYVHSVEQCSPYIMRA